MLPDASWLSGSFWVLPDALGYLGLCLTLSTFHFLPELIFVKCYSLFILILAIWVLPDALGYPGLCLTLLVIQVLSDAFGYLGTV